MKDILILATVLAPIILAFFELVKRTLNITERWIPLASLILGIAIAAIATPFTDLELVNRLWAGAFSGLSAVGLFELGKQTMDKEGK